MRTLSESPSADPDIGAPHARMGRRGVQQVSTVGPAGPETAAESTAKPAGRFPWRIVLEWVVLIAVAVAIAIVIRGVAFQAFYIPSGSMEPTLQIGDRVLVNKLSYDFHDVNRGDIIVFDAPPGAATDDIKDLVKRVVGLPGDTVTFPGDGHVYVNGRRLREPYLPAGVMTCNPSAPCPSTGQPASGQHVPPGCGTPKDDGNGCVVTANHLLVLGDNRQNSRDGRVFGLIDESTVVGRVFVRIWPIGDFGFL